VSLSWLIIISCQFVMANAPKGWSLKRINGILGDDAPTRLAVMGLLIIDEMDEFSLLVKE
jgi:2,3-bisphosphoglycerate-independent phosphoglycerate mutase